MTTYFVLRHWSTLALRAEDVFPLHPRHTRALLHQVRVVGRTTLLGTVFTGAAQGILAAIGYFATGVPEAAFLGAATAVASLVPAVGTLLVWVPAGIMPDPHPPHRHGDHRARLGWLGGRGCLQLRHPSRARGQRRELPALFMFAALFGGVRDVRVDGPPDRAARDGPGDLHVAHLCSRDDWEARSGGRSNVTGDPSSRVERLVRRFTPQRKVPITATRMFRENASP